MNAKDIILERMALLAYIEKRPFCFKDFVKFEHDERKQHFSHGTIRNIFSELRREGKIEKSFKSTPAFYTLKGVKFRKPITLSPTEDTLNYRQSHFSQWLGNLAVKKEPEVHDINLGFKVKAIWNVAYKINSYLITNKNEKSNKNITLRKIFHENLEITPTIHHTNNVSVVVACTDNPIPIDYDGILRLTTGLSRVEERLHILFEDYLQSNYTDYRTSNWIPSHMDWIVKMWHFNRDSEYGYGGERFEMYWKDALGVFRVYSKKKL